LSWCFMKAAPPNLPPHAPENICFRSTRRLRYSRRSACVWR
jgi:hypothetical protein